MRRKRRSDTVIWKASPRALGLMVFEISHNINSASTAASAMVVENANADKRLIGGPDWSMMLNDDDDRVLPFFCPNRVSRGLNELSLDKSGNNFRRTIVATKRKVTRNGRKEKTRAVGARILLPGVHSSQSPVSGTIDANSV